MRKMGSAFDAEKHCAYTGRNLYLCPVETSPVRMGYWRDDGSLTRVRDCTPQEKAWIDSNPAAYSANQTAFMAWLETLRK